MVIQIDKATVAPILVTVVEVKVMVDVPLILLKLLTMVINHVSVEVVIQITALEMGTMDFVSQVVIVNSLVGLLVNIPNVLYAAIEIEVKVFNDAISLQG